MKRITKILLVSICALIFVSGCSNDGYNRNKHYFIEIKDIDNFVTMYESDETYVTIISQTTCSYCRDYKKIINKIAYEEDVDIYWIEFDLLSNADRDKVRNLNERFESFGTPLTVFTKGNEIVDELNGSVEAPVVLSKLAEWELL